MHLKKIDRPLFIHWKDDAWCSEGIRRLWKSYLWESVWDSPVTFPPRGPLAQPVLTCAIVVSSRWLLFASVWALLSVWCYLCADLLTGLSPHAPALERKLHEVKDGLCLIHGYLLSRSTVVNVEEVLSQYLGAIICQSLGLTQRAWPWVNACHCCPHCGLGTQGPYWPPRTHTIRIYFNDKKCLPRSSANWTRSGSLLQASQRPRAV